MTSPLPERVPPPLGGFPRPVPRTSLRAGDRLYSYRLEEEIGTGGFGTVWKARHAEKPDCLRAIKVANRPGDLGALEAEADALRRLAHPHLVRLHAVNLHHGFPHLVMEFVDGKNLRRTALEEGLLPPLAAVGVTLQICSALGFLHGRGLVHRDVKPENILLRGSSPPEPRGRRPLYEAKLSDFGLARRTRLSDSTILLSRASVRGSARPQGTILYMSPEQRQNRPDLDGRADLFSLGVVLYEMLAGELPLGMDAPSDLNPAVPPELDRVCRRALHQDRERRFRDAAEMEAALRHAARALTGPADPWDGVLS